MYTAIYLLVVVAVIFGIVEMVQRNRAREQRDIEKCQRTRDEWLEGLLNPAVSLEKLMIGLRTTCPDAFNTNHPQVRDYGRIKLKTIRNHFSNRVVWKLVDVFVRNAEQHHQVLSGKFESGDDLIRHIATEIFESYGFDAVKEIENSSLSRECKQKLLSN